MIKRFNCGVCGKDFITSSDLSEHKLTHSDIKKCDLATYTCDMCKEVFKKKVICIYIC